MKPSDDLKRDIYTGKDAQTIEQISNETGLSVRTVRDHANKMVRVGIWKKVLLKHDSRFLNGYIKVK